MINSISKYGVLMLILVAGTIHANEEDNAPKKESKVQLGLSAGVSPSQHALETILHWTEELKKADSQEQIEACYNKAHQAYVEYKAHLASWSGILLSPLRSSLSFAGAIADKQAIKEAHVRAFYLYSQKVAKPNSHTSLQVMSYNAYFLPFQQVGRLASSVGVDKIYSKISNLNSNATERAAHIPEAIADHADIFLIQEAFDSTATQILVRGMQQQKVHFATRDFERSYVASGMRPAGSGLKILSKYPILEEDGVFFQDAGIPCFSSDTQADKGVLYAKILKDGLIVHVFTTHTQAKTHEFKGGPALGSEIRLKQFNLIADFIASKSIARGDAVILGGDMNVAFNQRPNEFLQMQLAFKASNITLTGDTLYTTEHKPLYEPAASSNRAPDQIDYFFLPEGYLTPKSASASVISDIKLSDHYPVVAKLEYQH